MARRPGLYLLGSQRTGRPRERRRLAEFPAVAVLRASAFRRAAMARGEPTHGDRSLRVAFLNRDGASGTCTVAIVTADHPIYRARWWLLCPRCQSRRELLVVTRSGPGCRQCLRLGYSRVRR